MPPIEEKADGVIIPQNWRELEVPLDNFDRLLAKKKLSLQIIVVLEEHCSYTRLR